jgi:hypothetical protein
MGEIPLFVLTGGCLEVPSGRFSSKSVYKSFFRGSIVFEP